jgi:hypothetical protein
MKKLRGRWSPTTEQIERVIDCSNAKMPLEKAAELLGVKPRTIWLFARRHGVPFAAPAGRPGTPKAPPQVGK